MFEWAEGESNPRHQDFQSCALPTELSARERGRMVGGCGRNGKLNDRVVDDFPDGLNRNAGIVRIHPHFRVAVWHRKQVESAVRNVGRGFGIDW